MKPQWLPAILESILADTLGLPAAAVQVRLLRSWGEIVGPVLGGKTFPGRIRNGVLTILVPNHAWAQELQMSTPVFLERIRSVEGAGMIREIRFTVETWSPPSDSPGDGREQPGDENAAERDRASSCPSIPDPASLEEIRDPETREILRSLSRKASRRNR